MSLIKAAVIQAAPILFDTQKTMRKLGELTREAVSKSVNLVVFPEAFIGGYPKGLDFGALSAGCPFEVSALETEVW